MLPKKILVDLHVGGLQQRPERLLVRRRGGAKLLLDVASQQHVELFHAAAAAPKQFPEFLRFDRDHRPSARSKSAKRQNLLDLADRLGWIQVLRASLSAVHDGVAPIEPEWILQLIETLAARLVAAVDNPPVGRQQRRRTQVAIAVPPVAGATGRATGTQDARRRPIDLFLILLGLQALTVGRRGRLGL